LWWSVGGTLAVGGAGVLAWWAQRRADRVLAQLIPAERRRESWMIDRPVEVGRVVAALCRRGRSTVGITTAVHGAGGFGKTTVAKLVGADRRVLRRFGGRVYWVTLGRDVRAKAAIADKVNDLITQLDPGRPATFTDPAQAGQYLTALLASGPRRLLVLDDIWYPEQEAAFAVAGRCARLVTTRIPSLVAGLCVPINVDQVSPEQARALLTADLPPMPDGVVFALMAETGLWPLLLRLVNKLLLDQLATNLDATAVAKGVLERLLRSGPLDIDVLTGASSQQLDVNDPQQRQHAVAATIEASTGLLDLRQRTRLAELAIFAEDETVPVTLIHRLWRATDGLDLVATRTLCARLDDLALLTATATANGGVVGLHDVVRDFLQQELGATRVVELHQILIDTVAADLPVAASAVTVGPAGHLPQQLPDRAWWELDESARYLWDHLIEHLLAAGRVTEANAVAGDLRWVTARLEQSGPVAPYTDLARLHTAQTARLQRLLGQTAHLLTPTQPRYSVVDILCSQVRHDPHWSVQATALARLRDVPTLSIRWPLPNQPDPALQRVCADHTKGARTLVAAPDGTWLAAASDNGEVRIWDVATGTSRVPYDGRSGVMRAMAMTVAPDGSWLACAGSDRVIRIWDMTTGTQRARLKSHNALVAGLKLTSDGTLLISVGYDATVRIWDVNSWSLLAVLNSQNNGIEALIVAPDGSWLASGDGEIVRIWDVPRRTKRTVLRGHSGLVLALVVAAHGRWLASAGDDGTVRIWDTKSWSQSVVLNSPDTWVEALAVAPDGSWLASVHSGENRRAVVRIWDTATWTQRVVLEGGRGQVGDIVVAADGTWLASCENRSVRVWDVATGTQRAALEGHVGSVRSLAATSRGTWLASAGTEGTVRIWDVPNTPREPEVSLQQPKAMPVQCWRLR
jgi:WD40 repeat protein